MDVWIRIDRGLQARAMPLQYRKLRNPGCVGEGRVIVDVRRRWSRREMRYLNLETGRERKKYQQRQLQSSQPSLQFHISANE